MEENSEPKYLYDKRFVPKRQYEVKNVWEHHQQMLRLLALGHSNNAVAEATGVTPQTISNLRNSPVAQPRLEHFRKELDREAIDIGAKITEFAPVALRLLEDVITGAIEAPISIRAKYASAHLGRAGYAEIRKVAAITSHLTRDDIEAIKMRALDAASEAGLVVED